MSKTIGFKKHPERRLVQNSSYFKNYEPLPYAVASKIFTDNEFGYKLVNYFMNSIYQPASTHLMINDDKELTKKIIDRFFNEVGELFDEALLNSIVLGGSILFPIDTAAYEINEPNFYSKKLTWRFFPIDEINIVANPIPFDKEYLRPLYYIAYNYILTRNRVIEFVHQEVPRNIRYLYKFLGSSIFQPMQDALIQDAMLTETLANYVDRGSQLFLFLKDFGSAMMNKKTSDEFKKRIAFAEDIKSIYTSNIFDTTESVEMKTLNLRGMDGLVKERGIRVANASIVPMALLTSSQIDDNSLNLFYKNIRDYQINKVSKYLDQIFRILVASETESMDYANSADIDIEFDSLYLMNPLQDSVKVATVLDNITKMQAIGVKESSIIKYANSENVDIGNRLENQTSNITESSNTKGKLTQGAAQTIPTREDIRKKNNVLKV